ncbi:hypothetical protein G5B46_03940 [Caulobacter sp. 602-2]|uniref:Uncharacterized protein n=1 Tax=Caulobacter sp. 602-2 TaxID=2710887 RepID=A0A6G4QSW9_9CAUL|nr:hypothetical protein [Caulobacter sp. 602-2]NGM48746.1 hypothetical protein [Caulobacter sp. 602-2]
MRKYGTQLPAYIPHFRVILEILEVRLDQGHASEGILQLVDLILLFKIQTAEFGHILRSQPLAIVDYFSAVKIRQRIGIFINGSIGKSTRIPTDERLACVTNLSNFVGDPPENQGRKHKSAASSPHRIREILQNLHVAITDHIHHCQCSGVHEPLKPFRIGEYIISNCPRTTSTWIGYNLVPIVK